jgi:hypothetical protein
MLEFEHQKLSEKPDLFLSELLHKAAYVNSSSSPHHLPHIVGSLPPAPRLSFNSLPPALRLSVHSAAFSVSIVGNETDLREQQSQTGISDENAQQSKSSHPLLIYRWCVVLTRHQCAAMAALLAHWDSPLYPTWMLLTE